MNSSRTATYVEVEALEHWSLEISNVNASAIEILNSYLTTVKDLENYMSGNVSTGFIKDSSDLVEVSIKYHEQMHDVEKFLIEVIDTRVNQ